MPVDPRDLLTALAARRLMHVADVYRAALHSLAWGAWKGVTVDPRTRALLHELVDALPAELPLPTDPAVLAAQADARGWSSRPHRRRSAS